MSERDLPLSTRPLMHQPPLPTTTHGRETAQSEKKRIISESMATGRILGMYIDYSRLGSRYVPPSTTPIGTPTQEYVAEDSDGREKEGYFRPIARGS